MEELESTLLRFSICSSAVAEEALAADSEETAAEEVSSNKAVDLEDFPLKVRILFK